MTEPRYIRPGWFTRHVFNPLVSGLTRLGISPRGSRKLRVRGCKSGGWRSCPVNRLTRDGEHYLVARRGEAECVRSLRAAGGGELRAGRRTEEFTSIELDDDAKPAILRGYRGRWKAE